MIKLSKYVISSALFLVLASAVTTMPTPCEMPEFLVDKPSIVVPIGATVEVIITDTTPPSSGPVAYRTQSSNPGVATATQPAEGCFAVTGVSRGGATITLTGSSSCGVTTKVIGVTVP